MTAPTVPVPRREDDGWADDAEYLANVTCASCGSASADAKTCEWCDVRDCCDVSTARYDCGGEPADGLDLCSDCAPSHRGCRHCDPVMPWED